MKSSLLFIGFVLLTCNVFSQIKTWNGPTAGPAGTWSTAANWLPTGIPGAGDTVIFNDVTRKCDLDVSTIIAAMRATNTGGNILNTSGIAKGITIGNTAASPVPSVLSVASTASLSLGNGGAINFSTYGPNGPNTAQIDGTLTLGNASSWSVNNAAQTQLTNVDIKGNLFVAPNHSGALLNNSSIATVKFLSGSSLLWTRDGGIIPPADYQDGSTINVTGVTSTMLSFGIATNYNGLIIWNCVSQAATVLGASAILLPTATYPMDSIRVVSTGAGTLRLTTDPNGYTVGHVEVQGGTLEMGSPVGSVTRLASIATDLKISGGTVILNATFSGEAAGTSGGLRLTVNGDILMTGGTLNLTNRPTPGTFGAGQIVSIGSILQTSGLITASSTFAAQNYISMDGGGIQNLLMSNVTNQVALVITNNVGGAYLQGNIVLPHALSFTGGFLRLNNFDIAVTSPLLNSSANGKAVTNGTGSLKLLSMPGNASKVFPVAISSSTYNPVTLATTAAATTNDYSIRVEAGNNPVGIYNTTRTINRTWYINPATNITSGTVNLSFQYAAADANGSCIPTANMELGHFIPGAPGSWNLDPVGSVAPSGTNPYTAGPFAPGTLGSSFVIGNVGSILAIEKTVELAAQKQNDRAYLNWTISNTIGIKTLELERSADGHNFTALASIATVTTSFVDDKLFPGLNYYRLKLVDANGKISYSAIVAILNAATGFDMVSLYPNVVHGNTQITITAAQRTKIEIVVTDISGRQLQRSAYNLIAGNNQLTLDMSPFAAGTYYLTGRIADGSTKTIGFVKQ